VRRKRAMVRRSEDGIVVRYFLETCMVRNKNWIGRRMLKYSIAQKVFSMIYEQV
jgi:hypothetical protein